MVQNEDCSRKRCAIDYRHLRTKPTITQPEISSRRASNIASDENWSTIQWIIQCRTISCSMMIWSSSAHGRWRRYPSKASISSVYVIVIHRNADGQDHESTWTAGIPCLYGRSGIRWYRWNHKLKPSSYPVSLNHPIWFHVGIKSETKLNSDSSWIILQIMIAVFRTYTRVRSKLAPWNDAAHLSRWRSRWLHDMPKPHR